MVKGQGQTAGLDTNAYIDPFALKSPNMVQYMARERERVDGPFLFSCHVVKGKGQTKYHAKEIYKLYSASFTISE